MSLRGLTIVVADANVERLRTALNLLCATAVLGARARLFLDGEAVAVLRGRLRGLADERHAAAGLPTLPQLLEEALGLGSEVILCQSGLQLTGTTMADHDPRLHAGGLVSLLASLNDDRLVTI